MSEKTYYRIVRFYQQDHPREIITTGLTLEQAKAHCNDPESSSATATGEHAVRRTKTLGAWFDGYEEEPYCNHDPAAVYDGICECGADLTTQKGHS